MMSKPIGIFDLEKHFAFYGAYHSNPMNVFIHAIFVWPNVFVTLLCLYAIPPLITSYFETGPLRFDVGLIFTLIHAFFYICLDKKSGVLAALLCFSCWIGSSFLAARLGLPLTLKVGVASMVFCWTAQFLSHGFVEKRSPALLDNLVQALLMGPFFALLQVMQFVFGYEPYKGFKARVDAMVESEINVWREKKQKKVK